ncbi:MAG TPA: hypothetical protein PKD73_03470 [Burkholderiaceae bacterium]|nr:hypothetical protein [Burkholderiaceae bacterium]
MSCSKLISCAGAMALAMALGGCSEPPQTLGASRRDAEPYTGGAARYMTSGWKVGDRASWESHLRARAQYGQNEYTHEQ